MMNDSCPIRWDEMTWEEIGNLAGKGIDMAILPVGATEQHGPHLPTGVDTFSAEAVANGASALTGIPVLPTIPYGCSLGHSKKWPGTLPLRPNTLAQVIVEIAEWLESAGFRRLLLLNGHVTNVAPLRCALENIRTDFPSLRIALRSIWEISTKVEEIYLCDGGHNWHANKAETSLMLHMRPDLVYMERAVDEPERSAGCFFSYTVDQESLKGAVGRPSEAAEIDGQFILDQCIRTLAADLHRALEEATPIEAWRDREGRQA
ncbi:MAG: creatininase family protein [Proteobacteria bacterium]|nr:MAG: creatininase family protein [Pseudomonadota bacterium]